MTFDPSMLSGFHFLRPLWLLALVPAALVVWLLFRQQSVTRRWSAVIAPHLLEHLVVRPGGRSVVRPRHLLGLVLLVAVVAAAGPTWRREPPPFTQDTAPLVLAIDLSRSMLVEDVQPSRLERARQKAQDILAGRKGARTALLAYAGTAHTVLPLTDDPSVLTAFLISLEPSIMPESGKNPVAALSLAETMLEDEPTPGTILFLTDGIDMASMPAFAEHARTRTDQVAVLAVATTAGGPIPGKDGRPGEIVSLDRRALDALEKEADAYVTVVTIDDTDVRRIDGRIATHLSAVQQEDSEGRWRDSGWWLVFPLMGLTLVWFRKGWTIQWEL